MCGIAGIGALDRAGAPREAAERMIAALHHRGPAD